MLEPEFLDLAAGLTVSLEPLSTHDGYGSPIYGTAVSYPAVVQHETRRVRKGEGYVEVNGTAVYVLSSSASIGLGDRVTLPDGKQPELLSAFTERDDEGQHHVELFCG